LAPVGSPGWSGIAGRRRDGEAMGWIRHLPYRSVPSAPSISSVGPRLRHLARDFNEVKRDTMRHIISVLLENEPGALSRVVGLFSARGYNIETLTVAPTEDQSLSRMTIVTIGSDDVVEQITKHLNRLIEVVKVVDLSEGTHIERELMLIKVRAVGKEREEMKRMADIFRGHIIDVTEKTYTIELTGNGVKLDAFIEGMDRAAILETVRTGSSGIGRGERVLKV
jgi:acetolactate synthase-1/3 small subunit